MQRDPELKALILLEKVYISWNWWLPFYMAILGVQGMVIVGQLKAFYDSWACVLIPTYLVLVIAFFHGIWIYYTTVETYDNSALSWSRISHFILTCGMAFMYWITASLLVILIVLHIYQSGKVDWEAALLPPSSLLVFLALIKISSCFFVVKKSMKKGKRVVSHP
jgi:hypothetical protein